MLLWRRRIPIIVSGADIKDTSRSAEQSATNRGFLVRAADCEHSEMSKVEFPNAPLNTTIPYRMIKVKSVTDVKSSNSTDEEGNSTKFVWLNGGVSVLVKVDVIIVIFLDVFLFVINFSSHFSGLPSILILDLQSCVRCVVVTFQVFLSLKWTIKKVFFVTRNSMKRWRKFQSHSTTFLRVMIEMLFCSIRVSTFTFSGFLLCKKSQEKITDVKMKFKHVIIFIFIFFQRARKKVGGEKALIPQSFWYLSSSRFIEF